MKNDKHLWSYSRIKTFVDCPASYKAKYIDKLPGAPNEFADRGKRVHDAIEEYAKHCKATDRETDYDALRAIAARYDNEEIEAILHTYGETHAFDWSLTVYDGDGIERGFEVELPNNLGIFRGRIDLVQYSIADGALWITDYKTSYHAPYPQPDNCPRQLKTYAWAMLKSGFNANEIIGKYDYVRANQVHEWNIPLSVAETEEAWIIQAITRILREEKFEAMPGKHCMFCDNKDACPVLDSFARDINRSPKDIAMLLVVMEETVKEQKSRLKQFVEEAGPVDMGAGRYYGYKQTGFERYSVKRGGKYQLFERIIAAGINPAKFTKSLDNDALAELVPKVDDPFGGPRDKSDGVEVDLSDILEPMKPRREFGVWEEKIESGDDE